MKWLQKLTQMQGKTSLSENQQGYIKRLNSTLDRINSPFNRPSKPIYRGQSHILVGISLGFNKPATLAVWDAQTETVLTSVSFKQLLGDQYSLFLRQRRQQQKTAHQRHKAQKQGASNSMGESELGQHVDRLIAKQIVAIAQSYQAASIAVPDLKNIRAILDAEIQAKAEQKCPGVLDAQKRYAKKYRTSIHRWSYARLIEATRTKASKTDIFLEVGKQPLQGSDQEKAIGVAIAAYQARN